MSRHTLGESRYFSLPDGRRLHYRQLGSGSPTVVFESGMGFSGSAWGMVVPGVAEQTTTIAYDRSGGGKSDKDDEDRTLERVVDDLEQFLHSLEGPFILVGYSWGGPLVRALAARRTVDVRGLVLVDQSDERDHEYFTQGQRYSSGLMKTAFLWMKHTVGLLPAAFDILTSMPWDCRLEMIFRDILLKGALFYAAELPHLLPGLEELAESDDALEGIETTVITGTHPKGLRRERRPALVTAHAATARALDRARLVQATRSSHFVPFSEPEIVVREILGMVALTRQAG